MNGGNVVIVPAEDRISVVAEEDREIEVPGEVRLIEVEKAMSLLGSKLHTAGDTKKWLVDYSKWLDNTASINQITVVSSLLSLTISNILILGPQITFLLSGGNVNDQTILLLTMTDDLGNIKQDTLLFTVVAP